MIIVDYREKWSGVPEELARLGAPVRFDTLNVGDYVVSDDVCIERKNVNDFVSSVVSKRLFEQVRLLTEAYGKPILVLEGMLSEVLKFRKIGYPQVYGALAAIVGMGVTVLSTLDRLDTARAIYHLYKLSLERATKPAEEQLPIKSVERGSKSIEIIQLNIVASIPGIDRELARRILLHFGTPRRFFKAAPSELRRIKGLGRARIAKIIEVLDTMHRLEAEDEGERR